MTLKESQVGSELADVKLFTMNTVSPLKDNAHINSNRQSNRWLLKTKKLLTRCSGICLWLR